MENNRAQIVREAIEAEQKAKAFVQSVCEAIKDAVGEKPMDGVTPIAKNACVVSFSTIASHNLIMAAEYYDQNAQARLVGEALGVDNTVSALKKKIDAMLEKREVRVKNTRYPLNPTTIAAIQQFQI